MKNRVLKSGDLVKYIKSDWDLDLYGFELGRIYEVKALDQNENDLLVFNGEYIITLVDSNGILTDHADSFAKHACPVILPRGLK